jgi:hypothetical protein
MIRFNRSTGLISATGLLVCALLFASVYTANAESDFRLGTAADFGVLAGSAVTNTGETFVSAKVGVWPEEAISGFPPGLSGGGLHHGDDIAQDAQTDLVIAYDSLAALPCESGSDFDLTGTDLGGLTLVPGVYCFSSSAGLTGELVLDVQGLEDPLFVFQIGSELTTASDSSVSFINGASCNVYWQVGSSATLGTDTSFTGNIVALTSITLTTDADISGRALARNGAVTMDTNTITDLGCFDPDEPTPTPTDVPPTETPVPPTATTIPATSTSIPATSTSVPATSTPTDLPATATVAPGSGSGGPEATVPGATATQPGGQLPSTPTGTVEETPSATGTVEQTPSATAVTDSTATVAVSTPTAQAPVAWPTSTAVATEGPGGSVTFPDTGTQGPVVLNTGTAMSTTNLVMIMALILLATAALVVTVDRRRRS